MTASPGTGERRVLHINHGPPGRGEANHIILWDPVKWWNKQP
ncbi:hypothetical protein [Myxococcus faecalis]